MVVGKKSANQERLDGDRSESLLRQADFLQRSAPRRACFFHRKHLFPRRFFARFRASNFLFLLPRLARLVCSVHRVVNRPKKKTGEASRCRIRIRFEAAFFFFFFTRCCFPPPFLEFSFFAPIKGKKKRRKNAPLFLSLFLQQRSSYLLPCSSRTREARELLRLAGKRRGD